MRASAFYILLENCENNDLAALESHIQPIVPKIEDRGSWKLFRGILQTQQQPNIHLVASRKTFKLTAPVKFQSTVFVILKSIILLTIFLRSSNNIEF